ncbi:DUF2470 domain-containing protein [Streptomyces sp. SID13031]|uniref:DUF2470 domain-containing protein n=1 Tax=Streptomyces sp. SID13031 TaxID=2706046 RepID=UPI0013CC6F09|nr:DUF2470 domain-containing protein [Streptomyces sp. SID13031]NEA30881.1 DUF2470 domain-containing protein [Streptomyces sp. SID13031]
MTDPFDPEIVLAVLRHMNEDHAHDSLLIVRTLGGQPTATSVVLTSIGPDGATFKAMLPTGDSIDVILAWSSTIRERPQFRGEFARWYQEAVTRTSSGG